MDVFAALDMQPVDAATLDAVLKEDDAVRILFLWGHDCPNCDVAKAQLSQAPDRFRWLDVHWLHQNVYDEPALATRFGLHGIPAFMVFRGERRIGRITPWPGRDAFVAAIERVRGARAASAEHCSAVEPAGATTVRGFLPPDDRSS